MIAIPVTTWWVCDCCLFARESEGCHDHEHDPYEPWEVLDRKGYESYSVTAGMAWDEHLCGQDAALDSHEREECYCEERDFSTRSCDGCGSHLAGTRHAYTLWQELGR